MSEKTHKGKQMPVIVQQDDIVEVKYVCAMGDQVALNIRHYKVVSIAGDSRNLTQIATFVAQSARPFYLPLLTNQAEFRGCTARRIRPLPKSAEGLASLPGQGTAGTQPLPPQICGLISLRTSLAGVANRGRVYVPFPDESDSVPPGRPSETYVFNMVNLAIELISDYAIADGPDEAILDEVLFHRNSGTTTDIESTIERNFWATQRRRGDFGSKNVPPV
jgi:hypothetical protein